MAWSGDNTAEIKKPQAKIVDNEDMNGGWPTLQDWQVVRARDSIVDTLTLPNPCGKRVALQSCPQSTLLKFSILFQHNLVDEALTLYYSYIYAYA
jgi:hypothetical protein